MGRKKKTNKEDPVVIPLDLDDEIEEREQAAAAAAAQEGRLDLTREEVTRGGMRATYARVLWEGKPVVEPGGPEDRRGPYPGCITGSLPLAGR